MFNPKPARLRARRRVRVLLVVLVLAAAVAAPAQRKKKRPLKGGADVVLPVEVEGAEGMEFHLRLPNGWKAKSKKKFPCLLALHGNGQAPRNIFKRYCQLSQKKSPLIVVAPKYQKVQQFNGALWPRDVCMKAFDWLKKQALDRWHGDPDRFFVQGFSMGGSYASLYVGHTLGNWKEGEPFPIRAAILNSGVAYSAAMKWPVSMPSLFIVGELETAVRGKYNVVESMSKAANGFFRQGADIRFHLMPGMKHAINSDCLEIARKAIFEECGPARTVGKEIAAFKKSLKRETRRVTRLKRIERLAATLPEGAKADRIHKSVAKLADLPVMVSELEARRLWEEAVKADRPGAGDRRDAYEALVKSHPKTEAGRRAKNRLEWMD